MPGFSHLRGSTLPPKRRRKSRWPLFPKFSVCSEAVRAFRCAIEKFRSTLRPNAKDWRGDLGRRQIVAIRLTKATRSIPRENFSATSCWCCAGSRLFACGPCHRKQRRESLEGSDHADCREQKLAKRNREFDSRRGRIFDWSRTRH